MKPVNLAAQLAAAETELACLKMALAQVKEDREELRQERDDWRREAAKLYAEKLIAAKLKEADERRFAAPPERRPWWRRLAGGYAFPSRAECSLRSAQAADNGS
jgi:hypothetical protein